MRTSRTWFQGQKIGLKAPGVGLRLFWPVSVSDSSAMKSSLEYYEEASFRTDTLSITPASLAIIISFIYRNSRDIRHGCEWVRRFNWIDWYVKETTGLWAVYFSCIFYTWKMQEKYIWATVGFVANRSCNDEIVLLGRDVHKHDIDPTAMRNLLRGNEQAVENS